MVHSYIDIMQCHHSYADDKVSQVTGLCVCVCVCGWVGVGVGVGVRGCACVCVDSAKFISPLLLAIQTFEFSHE